MLVSRYRPAFSARTRNCEVTDCPGSTRSTSIFDGPRSRTSPTGSLAVNITRVHVSGSGVGQADVQFDGIADVDESGGHADVDHRLFRLR